MSRSNRSLSQSNSTRKSCGPPESSLVTLQRDVDQYTRKLEFERKRAYASEASLEELKKEMEQRKTRIRQLKKITEEAKNRKASAALQCLRKQAQNNKKQYNGLLDDIQIVKEQINALRRERCAFMDEFVRAEYELQEISTRTHNITSENQSRREYDVDKQIKMLELQEKNAEDLSHYESQFLSIKDTFLRKKLVTDRDQSHLHVISEDENVYEALNTMDVLKNRLKKLIFRNKNKVKILDDYMRNLSIIDDGFNQIKEATGVTDIFEIENTFIKSEEQNHQLLAYSDLLNQQIDTLQDVTKDIERKIAEQEKENQLRSQILHSVPDDEKFKASVQAILNAKQVPIKQFQTLLDQILPLLEELLLELSKSEFNTMMPYKLFEYQNGILLNESTIDVYLSDMETYLMELLKFVAKKNGVPNTFTSALLMEEIPEKHFKQSLPMNIPVETEEINQGDNSILYKYDMMREQALSVVDKKREGGDQLFSNRDYEQNGNNKQNGNPSNGKDRFTRIQRGNYI